MYQPTVNGMDIVAIDCEMVGIRSECYVPINRGYEKCMLGSVAIVNYDGKTIYETFVAPQAPITNYRTQYSGINKETLIGAPSFEDVRTQVADILKDKILVGHSLIYDLEVLSLTHPSKDKRDTAEWSVLKQKYGGGRSPSLKKLSIGVLNKTIQISGHRATEDAMAVMEVYKKYQKVWEG